MTFYRSVSFVFILLYSCLFSAFCFGNEDALYGSMVPDKASFVRIFHVGNGSEALSGSIGDNTFSELQPYSSTPYYYFTQSVVSVNVPGFQQQIRLAPDSAYTVILVEGKARVIEDRVFKSKRKALVGLYNLLGIGELSLKANNGKVTVIEGVADSQRKDREINAKKLTFSVYKGHQHIGDASPVSLKRGQVSSLFVVGDSMSSKMVWVEDLIYSAE